MHSINLKYLHDSLSWNYVDNVGNYRGVTAKNRSLGTYTIQIGSGHKLTIHYIVLKRKVQTDEHSDHGRDERTDPRMSGKTNVLQLTRASMSAREHSAGTGELYVGASELRWVWRGQRAGTGYAQHSSYSRGR